MKNLEAIKLSREGPEGKNWRLPSRQFLPPCLRKGRSQEETAFIFGISEVDLVWNGYADGIVFLKEKFRGN